MGVPCESGMWWWYDDPASRDDIARGVYGTSHLTQLQWGLK